MQTLGVGSPNPLGRTRSWPIDQVASSLRRTHVSSLRSLAAASARFSQPTRAARSLIAEAVQVVGAPRSQVTGATRQFSSKAAQVAVFGAGAANTTQTKASDQLFRSMSGEDLSPPIFQLANEMTETKRQAGPKGRRS